VSDGGALEVDGDPTGIGASLTMPPESIGLIGTGVGGNGALRNVSGNNTWAGAVVLKTDVPNNVFNSAIGADLDTQLTVQGNVQDYIRIPVPPASLSKVGPGTLVFPNANNYSGRTFVNNGVLNIQNIGSLGVFNPAFAVGMNGLGMCGPEQQQ